MQLVLSHCNGQTGCTVALSHFDWSTLPHALPHALSHALPHALLCVQEHIGATRTTRHTAQTSRTSQRTRRSARTSQRTRHSAVRRTVRIVSGCGIAPCGARHRAAAAGYSWGITGGWACTRMANSRSATEAVKEMQRVKILRWPQLILSINTTRLMIRPITRSTTRPIIKQICISSRTRRTAGQYNTSCSRQTLNELFYQVVNISCKSFLLNRLIN